MPIASNSGRRTGGRRPIRLALALALGLLAAGETRAAEILYTAGTGGHLEALARGGEVGGGLPARARLVAAERGAGETEPLIVEAGGIFDPSFAEEPRRARVLVECLAAMGYGVIHLTARDLELGPEAIRLVLEGVPLVLVATNVRPARGSWPAVPAVRREAGGEELLVVGVVPPAEVPRGYRATDPVAAVREALAAARPGGRARLVVLSDLAPGDNLALARQVPEVAVIVSTRAASSENLRSTTVFPRTDAGMTLGRVRLDGEEAAGDLLPVPADLGEESGIRGRLTEYYRAVAAASPAPPPLDPEAGRGGGRYVGARICAACHREVFERWLDSPHTRAYDTLVEARRHELPACVVCHATGAGHPTGFTSDRTHVYAAGVQCEACHGPGSAHSRLPAARTIRREVPERICAACHTAEMSPGYRADPAGYLARAAHPAVRPPGAASADAATPRGERATVELYIMSHCPYGGGAARELRALADSLGESLAIEVRYIVRRSGARARPAPAALTLAGGACVDDGRAAAAGAPAVPSDSALAAGFSSLHGPAEVVEDLRQIAIAERYPLRLLLDYIALRADDPDTDWRAAAARLGMDPTAIQAGLGPARSRLAADAERTAALGIAASPTLRLNGAPLDAPASGPVLGRRLCAALAAPPAACAALPACASDADCRAPDLEGRCLEAGRREARCAFAPAPRVILHVFNDPACGLCSPIDVVAAAREVFPNLEVVAHDVTAGEGEAWIDTFDLESVPAFVFVGAESSAVFPMLEKLLLPAPRPGVSGRRFDPAAFRGPLYFRRPAKPEAVDLFLDATGELSLSFLKSFGEVSRAAESGPALARAEVRLHPVLESTPPVGTERGALRLVQQGADAYLVPESALPVLRSRLGPDDLAEARRQACIQSQAGRRVVDYLLDRADRAEAGVGDWRERAARLGLDAARLGRCTAGGEPDFLLAAGRRMADSLGIRPPAALVGNRLRFDGLGPWNRGAFARALAPGPAGPDRGAVPEPGAAVESGAP